MRTVGITYTPSVLSEARFSSRWGLLLSVLGIAVGTGNIWRFPRIAAQNAGSEGSGAFLVAWLVFLFVWSIPLIIAEYALGQRARKGVIGAFATLGGRHWAWMGGFVALTATAIMFYYSVVAGWCLYYAGYSAFVPLPSDETAARAVWDSFQTSRTPVIFHSLAMLCCAGIVGFGVKAIERVSQVLVPALLVIVLVCLLRALTLDGALAGVAYLFRPSWSQLLEPKIWLEALTQNAWDTGAGWGLILTYAAYMSARGQVVKNAVTTGIANNVVSLVAALTIFGTVFATLQPERSQAEVLAIMKTSGPASTGLTFMWMPQLFGQMPFGRVMAVLFFIGLTFAAVSSLISMVELACRTLVDFGWERRTAVLVTVGVGFTFGLPSALSLDIFSNQDFVWGVALMISGLFIALVTAAAGLDGFRARFAANPDDWDPGPAWPLAIRFVAPLLALILLGWWLYRSASSYARDTWWDPLDPFSVMTCLLQWGAAMALLMLMNRRLAKPFVDVSDPPEAPVVDPVDAG